VASLPPSVWPVDLLFANSRRLPNRVSDSERGNNNRSIVSQGLGCVAIYHAWESTVAEYFLDAELEQFLNEATEECQARVSYLAEPAKKKFP